VRIIAATNRDLANEMRDGRFRSDLFFRLNVVPLTVPPLRERTEDIPLLVAYFLSRFTKKFGRPIDAVARETMDRLMKYPWPGNIRELQNVIERAVVLSSGSVLRLGSDLLPLPGGPNAHAPVPFEAAGTSPTELVSLEEAQRRHIEAVLTHTGGVVAGPDGAARILELPANTLRSRMKKLGIDRVRHEIS
jgi:formate hydrogenlyase transcriptional activator